MSTNIPGCKPFIYTRAPIAESFNPKDVQGIQRSLESTNAEATTQILAAQIMDVDRKAAAVLKRINAFSRSRELVQKRIDTLMLIKGQMANQKCTDTIPFRDFEFDTLMKNNPALASECGYNLKGDNPQSYLVDAEGLSRAAAGGWFHDPGRSIPTCLSEAGLFDRHVFTLDPDGSCSTTISGKIHACGRLSMVNMSSLIENHKATVSTIDSKKSMLNSKLQQLLQRKQQLVSQISEQSKTRHRETTTAFNGMR